MQIKKILSLSLILAVIFVASCTKPKYSIYFQNNTYTPVFITIGSTTNTIPEGGSIHYSGYEGNAIVGKAKTYGTYGETLAWDLNYSIISTDQVIPLNIGSDYFFLMVNNSSSQIINTLIVNLNSTYQVTENLNLQPGYTYDIGYYDAFGNTDIQAILGTYNATLYNTPFTFTDNQSYTFVVH